MGGLGIFAVIFGLSAGFVAFLQPTRLRFSLFVLAYLLHLMTAFAFYQIAQSSPADADLYYYDPFKLAGDGFALGTQFIIIFVQGIKSVYGGSYLDYFLLFQAFGFFGIALLMRTFEEIHAELGEPQRLWTYALLFLPSLHYWSSAIGKDAPFFFVTVLALWSSMSIRRRLVPFGCAMLLMLLIRPHIAVLALAAAAMTVLADRSTRLWLRIVLAFVALVGAGYAVIGVMTTFNIDLTSADAVSDRMAAREELILTEDAGRSVVGGPLPVRMLSLLFRPFFFDARDLFGLLASLENAVVMLCVLTLVFRARTTRALMRAVPYVRFALWFGGALVLVLGFDYFNVGLGLRQKWTMIMPNILVLFVTVKALRAAREREQAAAPAVQPPWPPLRPAGGPERLTAGTAR